MVIAGLSNVYTHYITTEEEYQAQRYEAGSTIFGPNTLNIYLEKFKNLLKPLITSGKGMTLICTNNLQLHFYVTCFGLKL